MGRNLKHIKKMKMIERKNIETISVQNKALMKKQSK